MRADTPTTAPASEEESEVCETSRRIARLRAMIARGEYVVDLDRLAIAIIETSLGPTSS
jgi:anti-sigma28 factor (negative regulator of flagellin synthesis)